MAVDEYVQARPAPALRPYVAWYSGYRQEGQAPGVHRGLPSPYLTLIFTMNDPLVVAAHPDPRQRPGCYDALVGGLHLAPAMITHVGAQSGVQVALHPWGSRALLGLPAGELGALDVDAADILGLDLVERVRERLRTSLSWPQRFAAVESELIRRLRPGAAPHPGIGWAFSRLLETGGRASVTALARETGWSARHLTNRFRTETGLGVKEAARVIRFDRVRRRLRPGIRLAELAADAGYFDQAHLAREFRALAGCPPSRWLAEEIGFVQAAQAVGDHDEAHD